MYCLSVILCNFCDCSKWACSKIQGKNRTKEKQDASRFSGKFSILNSVYWNIKHVALTFGYVGKLSDIHLTDVMFSALLWNKAKPQHVQQGGMLRENIVNLWRINNNNIIISCRCKSIRHHQLLMNLKQEALAKMTVSQAFVKQLNIQVMDMWCGLLCIK